MRHLWRAAERIGVISKKAVRLSEGAHMSGRASAVFRCFCYDVLCEVA